MSEEEKPLSEQLEELKTVDVSKLDEVTIDEVRQSRPQIFGDTPFNFVLGNISKARIRRNIKTASGIGNMYILDTCNPMIYTFGNAYDQLERFVKDNKLKVGDTVRYVENYIPEGKKSFDTTYTFEIVK